MKRASTICAAALTILLFAGCDDDSGPGTTDTGTDTVTDTVTDTGGGDTATDTPTDTEATPQEVCEAFLLVTCERSFECFSADQIAARGWTTVDDCVADSATAINCTSAGTCPSGYTYYHERAVQCVADMEVLLCGDLIGGILPTSCTTYCE